MRDIVVALGLAVVTVVAAMAAFLGLVVATILIVYYLTQ